MSDSTVAGETSCFSDAHPEYWEDYTDFQLIKHQLVKRYLEGWFPILSSWSGRILYIDTHAGRGGHVDGQEGSPVVALKALLDHRLKEKICSSCEVRFFFIEADPENARVLEARVNEMAIPSAVKVQTIQNDCFRVLRTWLDSMSADRKHPAPAFVFIDPYGFTMPGTVLKELMAHPRVELFVNLMWREIDMHIQQGDVKPGCARNLSELFCGKDWIKEITGKDQQERAHQAAALLQRVVGAKWCTEFYMKHGPRAIRYILVHFSNHEQGRKVMKDSMWAVAPQNGYFMRKGSGEFDSLPLFEGPPSGVVESWVTQRLRKSPERWQVLLDETLGEFWREPHLNDVIRAMRAAKKLTATDFAGKCTPSNNPLLTLA
jgi:three-Cys-motif partner protein